MKTILIKNKKRYIKFAILNIAFIIACAVNLSAQNYLNIQKLKDDLNKSQTDTTKINIYKSLGDEYIIYNNDSALYYYNEGLKIAQEKKLLGKEAILLNNLGIVHYNYGNYNESLKYYQKCITINSKINDNIEIAKCYINFGVLFSAKGEYSDAEKSFDSALFYLSKSKSTKYLNAYYTNLGNIFLNIGAYDLALNNFKQSLDIDVKNNDEIGIAKNYNNIALTYAMQADYKNALDNFFAALKINEKINNKNEIANCLNNIGFTYLYQNDFKLADEYFSKALKIYTDIKNNYGMLLTYNNFSDIYQRRAENETNPNIKNQYLSTSIDYALKALKIATEQHNKNGIILSYYQIGQLHSHIADYNTALSYFKNGVNIATEINDKRNIAIGLQYIAAIYIKTKEFDKALTNIKNVIDISNELNTLDIKRQALSTLTIIYESKGDYKNAFYTQKEFQQLHDTIFSSENTKNIKQLEFRYQTEKKELEIQNLQKNQQIIEAKVAKQKFIIYTIVLLIILIVIVFSVSFVIFKRHLKNKEIQKRNELLAIIKAEKQNMVNQQTNPQNISIFIKSITSSIQQNSSFETDKYLLNYINYLKTVLHNSEHESIYLMAEIDCLKQFLQIEKIKNDKFSFNINFSDYDVASKYKISPMLIQPFIEDMLQYTQNCFLDNYTLYIDLSIKEGDLKCSLSINNEIIKTINKSELSNNHALNTNTSKRLENINKISWKPIIYNYRELKDNENVFSGLELKIIIPLQYITSFI